jgi:hypothetical protein
MGLDESVDAWVARAALLLAGARTEDQLEPRLTLASVGPDFVDVRFNEVSLRDG